ncbi:MAG: rhodanese-like domain-containing protein [Actinomycetota bacterium]|nr:rhodanese-like domain-containing protein [Actinomycetota bacterium]
MGEGSVRHVRVGEVQALRDSGAVLIDVREHQETAMGKAPGVSCMPLQSFVIDRLPADTPLVFICRSGNRSDAVATALAGMGYATFNVLGGMIAWQAAGLPVIAEDGGPGTVM